MHHRVLLLTALAVAASSGLSAQTDSVSLDAAARRRVVDSVASVLATHYADADVAPRLAARLRERLAAGAYDTFRQPEPFGAAMMRDLQDVVPDKHLRLAYEPEREYALGAAPAAGAARPGGASGTGRAVPWRRIDPRDSATIARTNFALSRVERFPGNVGYLKLTQFVPPDLSGEAVAAAMHFLEGSDAVVLDLRDNLGGSPELVEMIVSWFLPPEPTTLLRTYHRATDATTERRSWRQVPGRRMPDAALYVLVNHNSASAAEMLPYALQRLGRATIVGERTAGAGNGGAKLSVGAGLSLFVPQMRVVSGPGYERTGVEPDVAVPADSALVVARRLALEELVRRRADSTIMRERTWALELLHAESRPERDPSRLGRFAGRYGTTLVRTVRVEGNRLVSVGSTGWVTRLHPVDDSTFRSPETRHRFEIDARGHVTALVLETSNGRATRLPRLPDAPCPAQDDLACLSEEFTSASALGAWRQFHDVEGWPSMTRKLEVRTATGELYLEPWTSGWYADFHAPFLFREISGDFVVTTRLRADGLTGGLPRAAWSLAGLMVRAPRAVTPATWTPGGEDWLFITTGVAEDVTRPVIETKTTRGSQSRLRLHATRPGWVELRVTRVGAAFELASRFDGEGWIVRDRFERPDLPTTVQVGLNAYTDWHSTTALQADPRRFNTTVVKDGKPDLGVRVDWIRFARPG